MERIPEPDLMDDIRQAEAYAAADFSGPHDAFVSFFKKCFPCFSGHSVLDLGCGTADVIVRFAKAFPDTLITGIDGAQAMLDIAGQYVHSNGLSNRIRLIQCVLPDNGLCRSRFDAIISNSLLHHLRNPHVLWKTVEQCALKGTPVFIMDLFRPDSASRAEELVMTYADDAPAVLKKDFYNSLLASYTIGEIRQQLKETRLGYFNVETISDRHVLIWGKR